MQRSEFDSLLVHAISVASIEVMLDPLKVESTGQYRGDARVNSTKEVQSVEARWI